MPSPSTPATNPSSLIIDLDDNGEAVRVIEPQGEQGEAPTRESAALVLHSKLDEILNGRNDAIAAAKRGIMAMAEGFAYMGDFKAHAQRAHGDYDYYFGNNRAKLGEFTRLFEPIDEARSFTTLRQQIDASTWIHLIRITGISSMMDSKEYDEFYKGLDKDVPEVTREAVLEWFDRVTADAPIIFARGVARVFSALDRRFKSHDSFKFEHRMVITHAFDVWGYMNVGARKDETLNDVERAFGVLDGHKDYKPGELIRLLREARQDGHGKRQTTVTSAYFRAHAFKNGNLHLWFTRKDLVERVNQTLADYYGSVLPDGVPDAKDTLNRKVSSTAVSKDLAFYATPVKVAESMLRDCRQLVGMRVLEPSAGAGAIVKMALDKGAMVTAIEVDPGRVAVLETMKRTHFAGYQLAVRCANFLTVTPEPVYDVVLMNPPFYGTHWMNHIMHAMKFLKPGGELVAVLPISVELGQTKEHLAFREWAGMKGDPPYHRYCRDLPDGSFTESGTNVSTLVFSIAKGK